MTEQKYVRNFFTNYWKTWVVFLVIGLVAGYAVASLLKPKYEGAVTFTLSKKPDVAQSDAAFYVYDGYYAGLASVTVRNNFAAWLVSPKTTYDIYTQAGEDVSKVAADKLGQFFSVNDNKDVSTVNVVFSTASHEVTGKVGKAMVDYATRTYPTLATSADLHSSEPLVSEVAPPRLIVTIGAALALVIASFFVTLLMHYLKEDNA